MSTKIISTCIMKTAIFSYILLSASSLTAQEQQTAAESTLTTKFGIKGGVNFTNLYIDDVNDEKMKVGANVGFFAKIPITKGISFQPELLYSNKGSKVNYDNVLLGQGEYRYNLHYLELPLLFSFNIVKNFSIHAGGYGAYLLAANIKDLNEDGSVENIEELNAADFNRFDAGLAAGLGFDVGNFTIGARYNYGLIEIGKSGSLVGELNKNAKNSAINVFLGFAF